MNTKKQKQNYKLNSNVRFPKVRVITHKGEIMSSKQAMNLAIEEEKDLILINQNAEPPVVKVEKFSKFIYDKEQRHKKQKKNSKNNVVKEMKIRPNIAEHDLEVKANKTRKFLKKGNKVKITCQLRGRENANKEQGKLKMLEFAKLLSKDSKLEKFPIFNKRIWTMMLNPK